MEVVYRVLFLLLSGVKLDLVMDFMGEFLVWDGCKLLAIHFYSFQLNATLFFNLVIHWLLICYSNLLFLTLISSNLPGFLTAREKEALEEAETRGCQDTKWLPLSWCCQLVQAAREEGYIDCEGDKNALVNALVTLRRQCGRLLAWHHYNIPLVYTQV